jgi:hypothetical protein
MWGSSTAREQARCESSRCVAQLVTSRPSSSPSTTCRGVRHTCGGGRKRGAGLAQVRPGLRASARTPGEARRAPARPGARRAPARPGAGPHLLEDVAPRPGVQHVQHAEEAQAGGGHGALMLQQVAGGCPGALERPHEQRFGGLERPLGRHGCWASRVRKWMRPRRAAGRAQRQGAEAAQRIRGQGQRRERREVVLRHQFGLRNSISCCRTRPEAGGRPHYARAIAAGSTPADRRCRSCRRRLAGRAVND